MVAYAQFRSRSGNLFGSSSAEEARLIAATAQKPRWESVGPGGARQPFARMVLDIMTFGVIR
jgi:hypothetical protein